MTAFLIKSALSMAVLLTLYHLLLEREKMHRFNRFYLLGALIFSLALPFVSIPIYVEAIEKPITAASEVINTVVPVQDLASNTAIPSHQAVSMPPKVNYWPYIIIGIYSLVTLLLAIRFIKNIFHFIRKSARNEKVPYKNATLVLIKENILPHTFLNYIFINEDDYRANAIEDDLYTHELTHVKQRHTLDILFIEVLKTIFWFNPLLYFCKKAIQLNHEFLADEGVLKTSDTPNYQRLLLQKTAYSSIALASNLTFSLTKKRFNMMTKTTPKTKSALLKLSALSTMSLLLYGLCTHTVAYAETKDGKTIFTPEPSVIRNISLPLEEILPTEDAMPEQVIPSPTKDTIKGDSRRDEYFAGVEIVIEDKPSGIFISKLYEKLTAEQKNRYLPTPPSKKTDSGINEADYNFSLQHEDGIFYIDDKKVKRDEIVKRKKEDFASFAYKGSGTTNKDGKFEMVNQFFFYTAPFYNKNIKPVNDHYPDKSLKITVTEKPEDSQPWERPAKEKASGKSDLEIMEENTRKEISADTYPNAEQMKQSRRDLTAKFTGDGTFYEYLSKNLQLGDKIKDKQLTIFFTINTDGTLSDVSVSQEKDPEIITEVKRVIENSPRWIPSHKGGKPIKTTSIQKFPEN